MEPPLIRLEHPELPGQYIDVAESAVVIHKESGWVPVDGEPPEDSKEDSAPVKPAAAKTARGVPAAKDTKES